MRPPHHDPEWQEAVRRFVTPDRRYLRLGGGLSRLNPVERSAFLRDLARDAHAVTATELHVLLGAGWRERKTAAWLVAVAHRTEYRDPLGRLLLASEGPYAGAAYCVALATFATAADAELLRAYLDRYLSRPDLDYDQPIALGALLYLDELLGTEHAPPYLAPGGPWDRWLEDRGVPALEPERCRDGIRALRAVVDEAAATLTTGREQTPTPSDHA